MEEVAPAAAPLATLPICRTYVKKKKRIASQKLACNPETKSFRFFKAKHSFICILCSEIDCLCWEIPNNIGTISAPDYAATVFTVPNVEDTFAEVTEAQDKISYS